MKKKKTRTQIRHTSILWCSGILAGSTALSSTAARQTIPRSPLRLNAAYNGTVPNSSEKGFGKDVYTDRCFHILLFEHVLGEPRGSWFDALDYCSGKGGLLATVHTAAERSAVHQLLEQHIGADPCWFGLRKVSRTPKQTTSEWVWLDSSNPVTDEDAVGLSPKVDTLWMLLPFVERCGTISVSGWGQRPCSAKQSNISCFVCASTRLNSKAKCPSFFQQSITDPFFTHSSTQTSQLLANTYVVQPHASSNRTTSRNDSLRTRNASQSSLAASESDARSKKELHNYRTSSALYGSMRVAAAPSVSSSLKFKVLEDTHSSNLTSRDALVAHKSHDVRFFQQASPDFLARNATFDPDVRIFHRVRKELPDPGVPLPRHFPCSAANLTITKNAQAGIEKEESSSRLCEHRDDTEVPHGNISPTDKRHTSADKSISGASVIPPTAISVSVRRNQSPQIPDDARNGVTDDVSTSLQLPASTSVQFPLYIEDEDDPIYDFYDVDDSEVHEFLAAQARGPASQPEDLATSNDLVNATEFTGVSRPEHDGSDSNSASTSSHESNSVAPFSSFNANEQDSSSGGPQLPQQESSFVSSVHPSAKPFGSEGSFSSSSGVKEDLFKDPETFYLHPNLTGVTHADLEAPISSLQETYSDHPLPVYVQPSTNAATGYNDTPAQFSAMVGQTLGDGGAVARTGNPIFLPNTGSLPQGYSREQQLPNYVHPTVALNLSSGHNSRPEDESFLQNDYVAKTPTGWPPVRPYSYQAQFFLLLFLIVILGCVLLVTGLLLVARCWKPKRASQRPPENVVLNSSRNFLHSPALLCDKIVQTPRAKNWTEDTKEDNAPRLETFRNSCATTSGRTTTSSTTAVPNTTTPRPLRYSSPCRMLSSPITPRVRHFGHPAVAFVVPEETATPISNTRSWKRAAPSCDVEPNSIPSLKRPMPTTQEDDATPFVKGTLMLNKERPPHIQPFIHDPPELRTTVSAALERRQRRLRTALHGPSATLCQTTSKPI